MANTKISALPTGGTLDGMELIPVVKSGVTSKVPLSRITEAIPNGTYAGNLQLAQLLDPLLLGAITRDSNGAATAATATWPDGATGAYTALVVSSSFAGAVDSYSVTHVVGGVTTTYTQPTLTRDSTGAVTNRPAMTVA